MSAQPFSELPRGWHWLEHERGGYVRIAWYSGGVCGTWRVGDAIGRTTIRSSRQVLRLFVYIKAAA